MSLNTIIFLLLTGGFLFGRIGAKLGLPTIVGMVIFGILSGILFKEHTPNILFEVEPALKSFALTVILLRAGLGLKKENLQKSGMGVLLISFIPALCEVAALTCMIHWLFSFPWSISLLTAAMLSAVSPAVIVPAMLDLQEKKRGNDKGIPTLILAGASVDDILAITLFSVLLAITGGADTTYSEAAATFPAAIAGGIFLGAGAGCILSWYMKHNRNKIRNTEKTLILLSAAFILVSVGDMLHTASLLAVMTAGFILLETAPGIAQDLSGKLSKIWIFAEIILFVLIGFSLDITAAYDAGARGVLVILTGLFFRSAGVYLSTAPTALNHREKIFCMLAYIPKATVQAALGGAALAHNIEGGDSILALAVLSILITAPLGLWGIRWGSTHLLNGPAIRN
ncbi:MAG: cation:proton antiporter [Fibrobacterota bacterium]